MFSFIDQEKRSTTDLSWPTKKRNTKIFTHSEKIFDPMHIVHLSGFGMTFLKIFKRCSSQRLANLCSLLCLWHQDWRAKITSIFFPTSADCVCVSIHPSMQASVQHSAYQKGFCFSFKKQSSLASLTGNEEGVEEQQRQKR